MLRVFLREVKREPGVIPGLPRSGEQERTSRSRAGHSGREAVAIRKRSLACACKSEDLPVAGATTPNEHSLEGRAGVSVPRFHARASDAFYPSGRIGAE